MESEVEKERAEAEEATKLMKEKESELEKVKAEKDD